MVKLSLSVKFTRICCLLIVSSGIVYSQDRDVGSFLAKLMKEYVPKNTKQYTLFNGQPVYSQPDPSASSGDITRTLFAPSGNPFMNSLIPEGPSPFMNYGPWNPTPSVTPSSSPSFFSSLFGRSVDSNGEPNAEEKSEIITVDDLPPEVVQSNEPDVREFNIESSMSFSK